MTEISRTVEKMKSFREIEREKEQEIVKERQKFENLLLGDEDFYRTLPEDLILHPRCFIMANLTTYLNVEDPNEEVKFGTRYYHDLKTVNNTIINNEYNEGSWARVKSKRQFGKMYKRKQQLPER